MPLAVSAGMSTGLARARTLVVACAVVHNKLERRRELIHELLVKAASDAHAAGAAEVAVQPTDVGVLAARRHGLEELVARLRIIALREPKGGKRTRTSAVCARRSRSLVASWISSRSSTLGRDAVASARTGGVQMRARRTAHGAARTNMVSGGSFVLPSPAVLPPPLLRGVAAWMPALLNFVLESAVSLLCILDLHHALMHAQTPRRAAHRAPRDWGQTTVHTDTGAVRRVGTPRRRTRVAEAVRALGVWFVYLCVRPLVDSVLAWFVPFCGTLQTVWLLWMLANRSTVRGMLIQAPSLVFQRILRPVIARYEGAIDRATLWAHGLVLFLGFVLGRLVAPLRRAVTQGIPRRLRALGNLSRAGPMDAMEETAQELSQGPWVPTSLSTPIIPGRFAWREGKRATPRKASPSTPSVRPQQTSSRSPRTPRTPRAAQSPRAGAALKKEEDTPGLISTSTAAHAADALRAAKVPKESPGRPATHPTVKDEPSTSPDVKTTSPNAMLRRSQGVPLADQPTVRMAGRTPPTTENSDDAPHTPEPVPKDEDAVPASESAESALMRMLTERASRPTKRAPQPTPSPAAKRARRAPLSAMNDSAAKRAPRDAEQPAEAQDTPSSASARGRRATAKHVPEDAPAPAPKRRLRETHTSSVGSAKRVTTTVRTEPDAPRSSARAGAPRGRTASQTSLLPRPARASGDDAPELRRSTRARTKRAP